MDKAYDIGLDLMENRLLITGSMQGYPDVDVTNDQFYPAQNNPDETRTNLSLFMKQKMD